PFPSDVFTVVDPSHNTGIRINLPKPDCAVRPSDCADIDVLNMLDGFNAQPRMSIPFNGPIDPGSVSSTNVFLKSLGSTLAVGVATEGRRAGHEKLRDRIEAMPAPTATVLANFARANVVAIRWHRQVATSGPTSDSFVPVPALDVFPGSVGRIVFGRFNSPDWETPAKYIPAIGTRTGVPAVQGTNKLYFNLFVPSGTPPTGGWPVAIFGHGFTDSKQGAPFAVASTMAHYGIATIAINVVGHGGGARGTLEI